MFPSDNNQFPLSFYHSPSLTIPESSSSSDNNINNYLFQHQLHQNFLHGSYNYLQPSINPPTVENPMNSITKLSLESPNEHQNSLNSFPSSSIKPPPRKDRHTKISTAQGLRDRRVRLSIGIAREFFSLQDRLGFDKASKTLGWLLSKSKAAIDELASSSKCSNNEATSTHKGQVRVQDINEETSDHEDGDDDDNGKQVLSERSSLSKKKREGKERNSPDNVAREKRRAKARERARERTEKKKVDRSHQMESFTTQNHHHKGMLNHSMSSSAAPNGVSVTEYTMINSKLRGVLPASNYEDQEVGNYNHSRNDDSIKFGSPDMNNGIIRPTEYSSLNIINLSTEIHINSKPWDYNSYNQVLP